MRAGRTNASRALPRAATAFLISGLLIGSGPSPAWGTGGETEAVEVETVTVTARLLPEEEQQVPVSMAVIGGEALAGEGRLTLSDLDSRVANLQIGDLNGMPTIFMRGVGGGGRQVGFEPRTGLYIDGVFMNQPPLADALLLDLDRVEVLRGPQGSLFGQNTVSGAIHLVTKTPGERRAAESLIRIDEHGAQHLVAALDLPLVGSRTLLRLSGSLARGDGLTTNRFDGSKPDGFDRAGARARLLWQIAPALRADFTADTSYQADDWPTGEARSSTSGTGPDAHPGAYSVALDAPQRNDVRNSGLATTLTWDSPWGALTSISAWRQAQRHWVMDLDYSPDDGWILDYVDRYRRWSQEVRLSGRSEHLPLKWLSGVYAFRQNSDSYRALPTGSQIDAFIPPLSEGDDLIVVPRTDNRSVALFGTLGYAPRPDLRLDVGLRWVTVQRRLDYRQQPTAGFQAIGYQPIADYKARAREHALLPDVALSWDATPALTTYARYAMGSKSGGFDADTLRSNTTQPSEFSDETVNSYELGLKSLWLQRRLRANLALFRSDYDDYQVSQFQPTGVSTVTVPVVANAGRVRTQGVELELQARLSPRLSLRSSTAWVHAEYVSFRDGGGSGVDFSGNRTEYAPRWTSNNAVEYRRPVAWGPVGAVRAELSHAWRGRFYTQPSNLPAFHADVRSLLGARLGLLHAGNRWELSAYADNLLDDRYSETLNRGTLGTLYGRYGAPRTFGAQLQLHWD